MPQNTVKIPQFPRLAATPLRVLPLAPIGLALTRLAQRLAKEHPKMFRRLGVHAQARFEIDPTDLPFVLILEPQGGIPRITLSRSRGACDARIAGRLAALVGLVHGAYDGDALFFSRDLVIEGDTAAVLALRNAIDAAELDLGAALAAAAGPARGIVEWLEAFAERRTGVALTRPEEADLW